MQNGVHVKIQLKDLPQTGGLGLRLAVARMNLCTPSPPAMSQGRVFHIKASRCELRALYEPQYIPREQEAIGN